VSWRVPGAGGALVPRAPVAYATPMPVPDPAPPVLLGCERLACGRGRTLLRDVTLQVHAGERWFVLGPNGAGKSTLVATLLGLLRARGGSVLPVAGGDRQALGYVPQQQRFDAPLPITVAEFVGLGLPDGEPQAAVMAQVHAALQPLGIAELAERRVQQLSLGQQRRVLVARALARRPRLLVLDEPLANLDEDGAERLLGDLARWCEHDGMALVLVAHDRALARRFATHVALVADGAVVSGPAAAMLAALPGAT
jgi:ABC-type Mn2+/Zn2+ transport system ATPase subunit